MSKVFTPEAVRHRNVPDVGAFMPLAEAYRAWLPSQHWFVGGILLGSVLQGTQNHRSDIDLFIMFRKGYGQTATGALSDFRKMHAGFVPVNINLWSEQELRDGIHTIGHGFLTHLKWATENGGLIEKNPISSITLRERHNTRNDLLSYITQKVKKLREFSCEHDRWTERRHHVLEDVGMASIHATRRWLSLHGHTDNELRKKEDAVALLRRHRPASGEKLSVLLAADGAYARTLDACLMRYNHTAYINALGKLSQHVGEATVFLASLTDK